MTKFWSTFWSVVAALLLAAFGVLIVYFVHTIAGAALGGFFVLLGVGIALPTRLHDGIASLKAGGLELQPLVDGFFKGRRSTDKKPDGSVLLVPTDVADNPPVPPSTEDGPGA